MHTPAPDREPANANDGYAPLSDLVVNRGALAAGRDEPSCEFLLKGGFISEGYGSTPTVLQQIESGLSAIREYQCYRNYCLNVHGYEIIFAPYILKFFDPNLALTVLEPFPRRGVTMQYIAHDFSHFAFDEKSPFSRTNGPITARDWETPWNFEKYVTALLGAESQAVWWSHIKLPRLFGRSLFEEFIETVHYGHGKTIAEIFDQANITSDDHSRALMWDLYVDGVVPREISALIEKEHNAGRQTEVDTILSARELDTYVLKTRYCHWLRFKGLSDTRVRFQHDEWNGGDRNHYSIFASRHNEIMGYSQAFNAESFEASRLGTLVKMKALLLGLILTGYERDYGLWTRISCRKKINRLHDLIDELHEIFSQLREVVTLARSGIDEDLNHKSKLFERAREKVQGVVHSLPSVLEVLAIASGPFLTPLQHRNYSATLEVGVPKDHNLSELGTFHEEWRRLNSRQHQLTNFTCRYFSDLSLALGRLLDGALGHEMGFSIDDRVYVTLNELKAGLKAERIMGLLYQHDEISGAISWPFRDFETRREFFRKDSDK